MMLRISNLIEREQDGASVASGYIRHVFRDALTACCVEERMKTFAKQGKCTFVASCRGHEIAQAGIVRLLEPGRDWFFTYYRSTATALALGLPLRDYFLGMLSRAADPNSNGRNMPEHFSSRKLKLVAQTACTGSQYLPAVGAARAVKASGGSEIVCVESGEGAASEGEFFEALNWAAREALPVLFLVQNNGYAISTPQKYQTASTVHGIAAGFGVTSIEVDGTSAHDIYDQLAPMIAAMRQGAGPALVEAHVPRLDSHSSSDDHRKYRAPEELAALHGRDPILRLEREVLEQDLLTRGEIDRMRDEVAREVRAAADWADSQPEPSTAGLLENIYEPAPGISVESEPAYVSTEPVTMIDAINHGLREEMERNPKIVMWGEDIADPKGGVFGVTRGLRDRFGDRVTNAPLAEASIAGVAGGMAIAGYKPVIELQFGDYIWPAAMQLRNEIPTVRWRSNGAWSCPVVVRIPVGGYIKGGPWHSASIESFFAHIPGWRVVYPSCAEDAKGLIKTAARSGDPVVFLEHKGLYRKPQAKTLEPGADYLVPFGKGRVRRAGTDVTVITWGSTVYLALDAARKLEAQGRSVEVIDLRSIVPFDEELIYASVRKTNRVVIAHEDSLTAGFGAEIAARIAEKCLDALDAPVVRVAAKDSFVPNAPALELAVLPSVEDVKRAIERVLAW
jgi:2-oxoisovalerate dehydrogenase E1 component